MNILKQVIARPSTLLTIIAVCVILISTSSLYSQSIRLDESQSIWAATKTIPGILKFMSMDVHPPLYIILLHYWIQIFGTGIIATRSLSLIFFLITLPLIYKMAKESSNTQVALLTVILFALSPFVLWFSNETRMYTLFTSITTANHLFFLKVFHSQGQTHKVPYILTAALGMYTHYFFTFLLFIQFLYIIYKSWHRSKSLLFTFLKILFVIGILFSPWAIYVATRGFGSSSQPLLPDPTIYNVFQALANFLFGFQSQDIQSVLISFWPIIVLFFFLIFTTRKHIQLKTIDYFAIATFFPIIIAFIISFIRPVFLSRYLIFTLPTLFFLIAWSLSSPAQKTPKLIATGLLMLMGISLIVQNLSQATPVREDFALASRYVSQQTTPQDIIAISSPFTIYPIEFNYTGNAKLVTIPAWNRYLDENIPPFSIEQLQAQLEEYQQLYYRMFLVLSYDQGYEQSLIEYMNNHYHLIDTIPISPGIQIRIYQLRYD